MKKLRFITFFILIASCNQKYSYKNRMQDDLIYLSADSLEGRETGKKGEIPFFVIHVIWNIFPNHNV
jgi:hypothetical protein